MATNQEMINAIVDDTAPRLAQDKMLTNNFNEKEFACHCCGMVIIRQAAVAIAQAIRDKFGTAFTPNCVYRCPDHNAEVGGEENSIHLTGLALDITVDGVDPEAVAQYAEEIGCDGVGRYAGFTHCDQRDVDGRGTGCRWDG